MSQVIIARAYITRVAPKQVKHIQTLKSYLRSSKSEKHALAFRPRENYWSYDHTKPIRRGDNPNMETLINIPCPVL